MFSPFGYFYPKQRVKAVGKYFHLFYFLFLKALKNAILTLSVSLISEREAEIISGDIRAFLVMGFG
jgi:hypothetical protein